MTERMELLLAVGVALERREAQEQPPSVGERYVLANRARGPVLSLVTLDHNLRAGRKGVLRESQPVQIIRAAAFDHPGDRLAVVPFDIHVDPGVRIAHLPLD